MHNKMNKKSKEINKTLSFDERESKIKHEHERIHLSQMDILQFIDIEKEEKEEEREEKEEREEIRNSIQRKNAKSNVILSQDSLNEYHLKRNLLIGDIYIGHRYKLKDNRYGICMYCGPLHYINNGKIDGIENEFIGIALEKGIGKHDGEIKGKRYFRCKRQCGIFVKRNLLCKHLGPFKSNNIYLFFR